MSLASRSLGLLEEDFRFYILIYSLVFLSWAVGFESGFARLATTLDLCETGEEFAFTDAFQVQVTIVIFTVGGVNERCEVKCCDVMDDGIL